MAAPAVTYAMKLFRSYGETLTLAEASICVLSAMMLAVDGVMYVVLGQNEVRGAALESLLHQTMLVCQRWLVVACELARIEYADVGLKCFHAVAGWNDMSRPRLARVDIYDVMAGVKAWFGRVES